MKKLLTTLLTLAICVTAAAANAATCTWTSTTDGGDWSDPNNWQSGALPDDPNDTAVFPDCSSLDEYYTVLIDQDVDIADVTAGHGVLLHIDANDESTVKLQNLYMEKYEIDGGVEKNQSRWLQYSGGLDVERIEGGYLYFYKGRASFARILDADEVKLATPGVKGYFNYDGDLNGDGKVNMKDFITMAENWMLDVYNPQEAMAAAPASAPVAAVASVEAGTASDAPVAAVTPAEDPDDVSMLVYIYNGRLYVQAIETKKSMFADFKTAVEAMLKDMAADTSGEAEVKP
ncbi:MAG: hypothetical protein GY845_25765 [Planctomycetes bacterium]|nr:hypothetical protein [Planctomycetota bacterium]